MENNDKVQEFVDVLVEALDKKFDFASPEDKQFFYENIVEIILSSEEASVEENIGAFLDENYDNPEEMQTLLSEGIGSAVGKIFTGLGKGIGGVLSGLGSGIGAVLHGPAPVRYYDGPDRNKKKKPKDEKPTTTPPPAPPKPPVPPKPSNVKSGEFVGHTPKPKDYEGEITGRLEPETDKFKTDSVPYGKDGKPDLSGTGYTRTPETKGGSLSPSQAERFRQERQRRKEQRNADESMPSGTGQSDLPPIPDREKPRTTLGRPLGQLGRGKVSSQQASDVTPVRGQQPGRRTSSTGATMYTGSKNPDLSFSVAGKRTADAIRRRAAAANPREVYSGLQVGSKLRRESVEDSNPNSMITESLKFISKKAPYENQ